MAAPGFWDNGEEAQKLMGELKTLGRLVEPVAELERLSEDLAVYAEMASDQDEAAAAEAALEFEKTIEAFESKLGRFELTRALSGPNDGRDVYFSIQAGAGGTESCDWAAMLLRMYTHYFESAGYKNRVVDIDPNEEAGLKSVTLEVDGDFAYGYLKGEMGVHRLVRISPFDASARRHTSFAAVDVLPRFDDTIEVEINEEDIRMDFYRASGAGGQHVNKTSSAVRLTHIPTGVVVACQAERSQHKNRAKAMKMLQAKLYRLEEQKREEDLAKLVGEKGEIAWGSQIRSYVLQPYTLVKDHRTGTETSNAQAVLDGDIERFVQAYLRHRLSRKGAA